MVLKKSFFWDMYLLAVPASMGGRWQKSMQISHWSYLMVTLTYDFFNSHFCTCNGSKCLLLRLQLLLSCPFHVNFLFLRVYLRTWFSFLYFFSLLSEWRTILLWPNLHPFYCSSIWLGHQPAANRLLSCLCSGPSLLKYLFAGIKRKSKCTRAVTLHCKS